jgi:hypothetical protein
MMVLFVFGEELPTRNVPPVVAVIVPVAAGSKCSRCFDVIRYRAC